MAVRRWNGKISIIVFSVIFQGVAFWFSAFLRLGLRIRMQKMTSLLTSYFAGWCGHRGSIRSPTRY